jgi:uncharacterized membrane protein YhiD involved in acid resistance
LEDFLDEVPGIFVGLEGTRCRRAAGLRTAVLVIAATGNAEGGDRQGNHEDLHGLSHLPSRFHSAKPHNVPSQVPT